MIIGLTGKAGSGKDTVGNLLMVDGFAKYSFAMPIKNAINAIFGWEMDWWEDREFKETHIPNINASPRKLAQTMGTEWGRNIIHPDLWLMIGEIAVCNCLRDDMNLVITDVRFDNEAEMIRLHGGVIVHIERPDVEPVEDHSSEAGIKYCEGDFTLINDGTMDDLVEDVEGLPHQIQAMLDLDFSVDAVKQQASH